MEPEASSSGAGSSRRSVEQVLDTVDPTSFDWKAYEGTYKGKLIMVFTLVALGGLSCLSYRDLQFLY